MKNISDWSVGVLSYFVLGLGVAYLVGMATSPGPISFDSAFAYINDPTAWIDWLFGAVFAMTAATIVSGAVAGRIKFKAYGLFALLVATIIYPVVQGLVWQGGLLTEEGYVGLLLGREYLDFAGATVVHMTGGVAGAVAALMVGPRYDRYDEDGNPNEIRGHSILFAMLGALILAFGWYGFNVGTQATILTESGTFKGERIGRVALNTTLGMGAGALASVVVTSRLMSRPDPLMTANGLIAGLVAVTGAVPHVTWWGGVVLGALGGALVTPVHRQIVGRFKIDDVCGVFAVHGVSGAIGTLLIPFFAVGPDGGWQFLGIRQVAMQALGIGVIALWAIVSTIVAFVLIKAIFGVDIRVSREDEHTGLDASEHGVSTYPDFWQNK